MTIEEFYEDFKQNLLADSGDDFVQNSFIEKMCEVVSEQGTMPDAELVGYKFTQRGIAVDAFAKDSERNRYVLVIADFRNTNEIETITNTDITKSLKRLDRFVEYCGKRDFVEALEESDPVFPLARYIFENRSTISFDFILITDAKISARVKEITPAEYDIQYAKRCEVWDVQRLYELESSGRERETLEVDFTQYLPEGIECLRASTGDASLKSYLFVLPGQILADLYEKYGERLLEQNVRTFLQFRGNVNKGIRNTIKNTPAMFFAYNNGLSAPGEEVVTDAAGTHIKKITNLQIVNGGQTTASIYTAWRKENANLDGIFVQVKLSVVDSEKVNDIVPQISEFANTQNKVNAADFFSNHPFHLRIEEFSRRIWAPAADGTVRQTKWFYERVRGQYANAKARLSKAEEARFEAVNDKKQMFTKTDLAKYYLTFNEKPFLVCLGAQKAFSGASGYKGFVSIIADEWARHCNRDGENTSINEVWFKNIIAQTIMFKTLNNRLGSILRELNYGSYRSVIVPYTLARFIHEIAKTEFCFDFGKIWQSQTVAEAVMENLLEIANTITYYFMDKQTNVSEFAKRESCWQEIQNLSITLHGSIKPFLRYKDDAKDEQRNAQQAQKDLNKIHVLQYVVEKGEQYWWKLRDWDDGKHILSPKERGVLDIACKISRGKIPSDAQAKILVAAEKRAIEEGFYVE